MHDAGSYDYIIIGAGTVGCVRITSADPRAHPAIAPGYMSTDEDRKVAVAALRLTRRIVSRTRAMANYEPEEFLPGPRYVSDEALVEAAGNTNSPTLMIAEKGAAAIADTRDG